MDAPFSIDSVVVLEDMIPEESNPCTRDHLREVADARLPERRGRFAVAALLSIDGRLYIHSIDAIRILINRVIAQLILNIKHDYNAAGNSHRQADYVDNRMNLNSGRLETQCVSPVHHSISEWRVNFLAVATVPT